ncbi:type I-F CRISPR-associated endoribonuclease Cas6/Csy4 [Pseudoalteromonas sp. SR44-8]|nr:type I-F CRISPR-associated endoribonuclease Cas6/Csy4 [Pseudoalteromonas sp. SR41-4]MBB1300264.1 type I-F CRISPR-associated endoribonuclease Cas6/Csy4 [Pseudoalteromonas sp. SR44-8]MBB1340917.1 type I-F CRISPR-associated endoribonuclease Cas6/Csy4 [Pseudoalteromonas sp. SR45-6]
MFSGSTEQVHRKFFAFSDLKDKPIDGKFDSYGLSKVATIPWF